ncbi:MAG TPA: hypothetical protein PLU72_03565 [Candidatus Ozemobacteraceae bacterium]|nr:hypothetical protein [Candidatus Ozemobacteraceae bacterium]HQG27661.1 hypothetical protein [Candidatus Ozemobacteraceae bacterium]
MLRIPRRARPWILLFAFWLMIEPMIVPILQAEELPSPTVNSEQVNGIANIEDVMSPDEYLQYMLELRGSTKEECEAKAWSDWLSTISGVYMMMDAGQQDVFSFYSTIKAISGLPNTAKDLAGNIKGLTKKATLAVSFFGKINPSIRGANMFNGFLAWTNKLDRAMGKNKAFTFLEFMAPPPCWNNPKVAGEGFKSYLRWVKKTTGHNAGPGRTISNVKGAARTCGIGLAVLGLALSTWQLIKSEDRQGGRYGSYSMVKNYVDIAFGAAALVCMFCIPVVGQVVAVLTLAWMILTTVGDIIGEHNKKWKEAYRASHWFLMQNDKEYESFYNNRSSLKQEEKSASLILAERDYGQYIAEQQPSTDEDKKQYEAGKAVYTELEKQGVLMTYYNQTGFTLPDFDMARLMELWHKKADYMSWKPNEKESDEAQKRGFFGTIGHVINPMTYISWVGNKIDSHGYEKEIKNADIKRVFFNPDYVLVKKYKNYLMAKNLKEGIYDAVGLRIEQSPFNYIYLLGIDTGAYSEELLKQSLEADAFIIGSKEMMFFAKQAEIARESMKKVMKENDKIIEGLVKSLESTQQIRRALSGLLEAYKYDPDVVNNDLYKKCHDAFGWQISDKKLKTPKAMIDRYKAQLEEILAYVPVSTSQKAAEIVLIMQTIKHNLDTAKLMNDLWSEKDSLLNVDFDKDFTNDAIRRYLKEGTFLDVKGSSGFLGADWLSGIYPAYEEHRKFNKLYLNEAKEFSSLANRSNSDTRDGFLGIDYHVKPPAELLQEYNQEISSLKEILEGWNEVKDQMDIKVAYGENPELYQGVFKEGGFQPVCDTEAMDLDSPVLMPMNQ